MDPGVPSPNANTGQEAQCKLQEWSSQARTDLNTSWVAEREVKGQGVQAGVGEGERSVEN